LEITDENREQYTKAAIVFQKYTRRYLARKLKKETIVRKHIALEILTTEESYVHQLDHVVLDYMPVLGRTQVIFVFKFSSKNEALSSQFTIKKKEHKNYIKSQKYNK